MQMEVSNVTSQYMDLKTQTPNITRKEEIKTGYGNVKDYSEYLQDKYNYMNAGTTSIHGIQTSVNVSGAFLKKCKDSPEKAAFLEENLAAIPNCVKMAERGCQGTITNLSYKVDSNGNLSVAISGSSDPDGKIARENAKRKAEEEKEAKEKLEKKRTQKRLDEEKAKMVRVERKASDKEFNASVIGADVRDATNQLVEKIADGAVGSGIVIAFDAKA